MSSFTVKQIAEMLKTNEETVRRWIRAGKLDATIVSKKSGNIVTGEALKSFIKSTPKYAPMLSNSPMTLSIVLGGLLGGLIGMLDDVTTQKISEEDIRNHLQKKILEHKNSIKQKKLELKKLQKEIGDDQESLKKLEYAIENLDLAQIAEEINNR